MDKLGNILTIVISNTSHEMFEDIQNETALDIFPFIGRAREIKAILDNFITEEEQQQHHTQIVESTAEVTAGWESMFDFADQAVKEELKQKAEEVLQPDEEFEDFLGIDEDGEQYEEYGSAEGEQEELEALTAHLEEEPFDYDAVNRFVEIAMNLGHLDLATNQLHVFASGLEQAGDQEGALNCYQYILELDPDNEEAKARVG